MRLDQPQCYQITADTSPTTPRALAQITSWEGKRQTCEFLLVCAPHCAHACRCGRREDGQKVLQLSADGRTNPTHLKVAAALTWATCSGQPLCREGRSEASVSCILSARGKKLTGENEMSIRWGWGQYGTMIKAATTHMYSTARCKCAGGKQRFPLCPLQKIITCRIWWAWNEKVCAAQELIEGLFGRACVRLLSVCAPLERVHANACVPSIFIWRAADMQRGESCSDQCSSIYPHWQLLTHLQTYPSWLTVVFFHEKFSITLILSIILHSSSSVTINVWNIQSKHILKSPLKIYDR